MNFIAVIILVFILLDFLFHLVADILNLRALTDEIPVSFKDVYDQQQYEKSQKYLRVNTRFQWICGAFDLVLILCFWFGCGFSFLDQWVRGLEQGPIISGLIFIGTLVGIKSLLSLPFRIYDTFVIEERFGFNKTTCSTFFIDIFKVLLLALLIGTPVLALVLWFFLVAGDNAWWYCWIAMAGFVFMVQFVAPRWIMPLFNKFDPIEDGDLKSSIMSYAENIRFSLKNVYVMDGSKRSDKSNAFFTGFGNNKRIVLFDTLIKRHTVSELVSVLAHEMGHYKLKHIPMMMAAGILQMGILFYLLSLFISYEPLFQAFYLKNTSVYAGLIFFGMLFGPMDFFIGIVFQMVSRKNEYQADRFAVNTTEKPLALADALKKLSVHNLSNLKPHPLYVFLNYSHPPVLERIKAIEEN